MHKNERRFRDAIMPDEVSDGVKTYVIPVKWIPNNIVKQNGRMFNLAGQEVSKNFKGIVVGQSK